LRLFHQRLFTRRVGGAYAIRALPDLCLGIVSGRLETHSSRFLLCYATQSPGTPGAFFYWSSCHRPTVEFAVIEQREFELPADSGRHRPLQGVIGPPFATGRFAPDPSTAETCRRGHLGPCATCRRPWSGGAASAFGRGMTVTRPENISAPEGECALAACCWRGASGRLDDWALVSVQTLT
jgi:hypothetical protein